MENSITMNGGQGKNSYFRNSQIQGQGLDQVKDLLVNSIEETLEVKKHSRIFTIADHGCSVGPNTFSCVKTIIEAVQNKYNTHGYGKTPEFHVFFNDHVTNDFNTLFKALPSDRQYMAAGVPGSFQGRLLPGSSMNLMHSAFSLNWLSRVPQEVTKEDSLAWNKGKITYARSSTEVMEAFRAQFSSDMKDFLKARSEELGPGGLLVIVMPCRPEGSLPSEAIRIHFFECLGDALADMVKEGLISEDLANSFNIPIFFPMASEVKELVASNEHLNVERFQEIYFPLHSTPEDIQRVVAHIRATLEGILCKRFGPELVDELFNRYPEKLEKFFSSTPHFTRPDKLENLFLLAKRSDDN